MTSEKFKIEIIIILDSRLRRNRRYIILLIDNCSAHPNINELLTHIKLVFQPPKTTSILQLMYFSVNLNLKVYYRKLLVMDQNLDFKIDVFQDIQIIEDSCSTVPEKTIINCFNHTIGYDSDNNEENVQRKSFVDQLYFLIFLKQNVS